MSLPHGPTVRRFGDFTLDLRAAELRRGGRKIRLQEQPFQILALLLARPGDLVTREEIQRRLWPADTFVDFDHGLNNAVARLREALRDSAETPQYVETVARRGYRFISPVTPVEVPAEEEATALEAPPAAPTPGPEARGKWRRALVLAGIAGAAITITIGAMRHAAWTGSSTRATAHDAARVRAVPPPRPEAYDLYLRARYHLRSQGQPDVEEAISLLQRATTVDPQFALAQAELARAYRQKAFLFAPQQKDLEDTAFVAVEKALALDPALPEGHVARGRTLWTLPHRFPHDAVIEEYRRALAGNPDLDEAHYELGHVYNHVGLLPEGFAELSKAAEINPSNTQARFRIGINLAYQGRDEEALEVLRGIPRSASPSLWGFQTASLLLHLGRRDQARDLLAELARDSTKDEGGVRTSVEALLLAQSGARTKAMERITTAIEIGRGFGHFHHTAYNVGSAYALLGEPQKGVQWLETAADEGFPCYPLYVRDPNLRSLRGRPDFDLLLARMRKEWERRRRLADAGRPAS